MQYKCHQMQDKREMFLYLVTNLLVSKMKMCCVVYKSPMQTQRKYANIYSVIIQSASLAAGPGSKASGNVVGAVKE